MGMQVRKGQWPWVDPWEQGGPDHGVFFLYSYSTPQTVSYLPAGRKNVCDLEMLEEDGALVGGSRGVGRMRVGGR